MGERDKVYERIRERFRSYLIERFDGNEEMAGKYLDCAEDEVPRELRAFSDVEVGSIYELRDVNKIEECLSKISERGFVVEMERTKETSFIKALRLYRAFLKSYENGVIEEGLENEEEVSDEEGVVDDKDIREEGEDSGMVGEEEKEKISVASTIYIEGEIGEREGSEYRRRNRGLREACKEFYRRKHGGRVVCECCGFDFERAYDLDLEDAYIEVHHLHPISQTEGEHEVNAERDLVPLCANCHRMIHRGNTSSGECMTLEELKQAYRGIKYKD